MDNRHWDRKQEIASRSQSWVCKRRQTYIEVQLVLEYFSEQLGGVAPKITCKVAGVVI